MLPALKRPLTWNVSQALTTASSKVAKSRWYADVILLSTAAMWGINIIVFKSAIRDVSPWVFNGLRLVFAAVTLGVLSWAEARVDQKGWFREVRSWPRVVGFCFLSGFIYMLAFVQGIENTTAGNTALLLASMPMWTAILSFFVLGERLKWLVWLGLAVTFCGTLIVITGGSGPVGLSSEYFIGNLFMLAAAITWAMGTVFSKSILETISPLKLAFLSSLLTAPFHLAISAYSMAQQPDVIEKLLEPAIMGAIIYSGVFSTGVAYATWHAGVRAVGGSHASVYQNVVTLVAVVGGWLLLNETVMAAQIVGGIMTVAGLLIMRNSR